MPKIFDLSKYLNKKKRINKLFFIIVAVLFCIGSSAYLIISTKENLKDTIVGVISLCIFFCIIYSINCFFDNLFSKYPKHNTLVYTLYEDRILYRTNVDLDAIFLDEIQKVTLYWNKSEFVHEICFNMKEIEDIKCLYIVEGEFNEYFKKYLTEHNIDNNL